MMAGQSCTKKNYFTVVFNNGRSKIVIKIFFFPSPITNNICMAIQLIVSNTGAAVLPMVSTTTVVFFLLVAIDPVIILPTTSFVLFLCPTSSPQQPRTTPSKTTTAKQLHHGRSRIFLKDLHHSPSNNNSSNSNTSMVLQTKNTSLLFVYGTLKHGFYNHHRVLAPLSEHWKVLSQQATLPVWSARSRFFVDRYYIPYLVLDEDDIVESGGPAPRPTMLPASLLSRRTTKTKIVRGEILEVDAKVLQALDDLEGVSQGRYRRSEVWMQVDNTRNDASYFPCFSVVDKV